MTNDHGAQARKLARAARAKSSTPPRSARRAEQIGRVEEVGDGIALVSGLPDARLDELLQFEEGQSVSRKSLERDRIGCVLLDDVDGVEAGDRVRGTGDVVRAPVGPELLGRVVDPLGRPLDGKGPISTETSMPIERPAPAIIDRDLVVQPVQTGLVVIDALFALGRGQRELIIGDRAIGKTTIGIDTIINQKTSDIICVYVAIGQKSSSVRRAIDAIFGRRRARALHRRRRGSREFAGAAMDRALRRPSRWPNISAIAASTRSSSIDDLTKHAATHREIALLTRQSPGREAYPGDVFYVHARLLERASKLSKAKGGGSLTALPIAETDAGNLSAYIPTNLISITDGQIVLDAKLFHEGQKPAVDVGTSVSRVGGKTQARALRETAETLRLDYAQFLELEAFTRFGGMSDVRVKQQLTRGGAHSRDPRPAATCAFAPGGRSRAGPGGADGIDRRAALARRSSLPQGSARGARSRRGGCRASIQSDGALDEASKTKLRATLQAYVRSLDAAPPTA